MTLLLPYGTVRRSRYLQSHGTISLMEKGRRDGESFQKPFKQSPSKSLESTVQTVLLSYVAPARLTLSRAPLTILCLNLQTFFLLQISFALSSRTTTPRRVPVPASPEWRPLKRTPLPSLCQVAVWG